MLKKICNYIIIASTFLLFFVISSMLPGFIHKGNISVHVEESVNIMREEGLYPSVFKNNLAFLDNWADSVLINIIYCQNEHSFNAGISNMMVSAEQGETVIDALNSAIKGGEATFAYSNYWLGCKLPLKLAFCFFNIGQIRYILYIINIILCLSTLFILQRCLSNKIAMAYFVTMALFATFLNVASLSASFDLLTMHIEIILLLLLLEEGKKRIITYLFFAFGAICSFLQWVYIPAVLPGMLGIICMLYEGKHSKRYIQKEEFRNLFFRTVAWIGGYIYTSLSKQIICLLFLGNEIGSEKMKHWSVSSVKERFLAVIPPLKSLLIPEMLCIVIVFALIVGILLIGNVIELKFSIEHFQKNIVVILVSLLYPLIWFLILPRATSHGWYCQNFMPVFFTMLYAIADNCRCKICKN